MPKIKKQRNTVWRGPEEDGITYSLLSRFLVCRERFRLLVVEGLRPADRWNHRVGYGSMWHILEETLAEESGSGGGMRVTDPRSTALTSYARAEAAKYPLQAREIDHWYNVCRAQWSVYVRYWHDHPDVQARNPLYQEQVFAVPYRLPSGRVVRLRGKWDSVDVIGSGRGAAVYLQENKTKGDIREGQVKRQLSFDLQTMVYMVALKQVAEGDASAAVDISCALRRLPIAGVRYNVVRRPLSGGAGNIRRHKPTKSNPAGESKEEYYERLRGLIEEDPGSYFMRWQVEVTAGDLARFKLECLDPVLEQLCDWWQWISADPRNPWRPHGDTLINGGGVHSRHPFGVYNVLDEGGVSDLDEYLATGSTLGLEHTTELFPELG